MTWRVGKWKCHLCAKNFHGANVTKLWRKQILHSFFRDTVYKTLVGASARGPAFSWVYYIPGACGDYSCAALHILISPAFHTILLALCAAIYYGLTRETRLQQTRSTSNQPAILPVPSWKLGNGIQWANLTNNTNTHSNNRPNFFYQHNFTSVHSWHYR